MNFTKVLAKLLLMVVGGTLLLYLIALAINRRDAPPSAEWLRLHKVLDDRPAVADAENSYVYLLGFKAPATEDPEVVGALRRDWIETAQPGHLDKGADPLKEPLDFHVGLSKELQHMKEVCGDADRKACADALDAAARARHPSPDDSLFMARYEKLLTIPRWREIVVTDFSAPLPPFADVIHAQRLEHLRMWQLAGAGDTAQIKRFLGAEFLYWRATLRATNGLISRMIAVAALRNHFFFANESLRRLPADQMMFAVPNEWSEEFTAQDRSMLNVMAGELRFIEGVVLGYAQAEEPLVPRDDDEPWTKGIGGRLISKLARPLFKAQDENNHYAESFVMLAEHFDVPMNRYAAAAAEVAREEKRLRSIDLYNLPGDLLRTLSSTSTYIEYAYRGAGVEGMRRAALLTTQLRARGVPAGEVADELDRAGLRDPFTGKSFEWSAADRAVVFVGPEKHPWHRQVYFY